MISLVAATGVNRLFCLVVLVVALLLRPLYKYL